jgi:rhamnosyltransferase
VFIEGKDILSRKLTLRKIFTITLDLLIFTAAYFIALEIRFDGQSLRIFSHYTNGIYIVTLAYSLVGYLFICCIFSETNTYEIHSAFLEQAYIVIRDHFILLIGILLFASLVGPAEEVSRRVIYYSLGTSALLDIIARLLFSNVFHTKGNVAGKNNDDVQHVFIIGSKGIPSNYGGYETFVDKLTEYHQNEEKLKYHIACRANLYPDDNNASSIRGITNGMESSFTYHNAECFKVKTPEIGSAQAIFYDTGALQQSINYIREYGIQHPIVYVLACRIGPFIKKYVDQIHELGGLVYVNPDGHEWMRGKWSKPIRVYWKYSEKLMVKYADLLICDSKNIERYIQKTYISYSPKTTYIAYGAENEPCKLTDDDPKLQSWYRDHDLSKKDYYLAVGRFVPENNYETMIREFMRSNSKHDFVIITTANDVYKAYLDSHLHFSKDPRIKFVGTVYDQELLKKIRENAYGYLHGHEVGGTNPSLLEALGSTDLNLLLDVGFNRECGENGALYWTKSDGNLAQLIDKADKLSETEIDSFSSHAKERIITAYSWKKIAEQYKNSFGV